MEYQKTIDMLGNAPNQPSKFRTNKWLWINDDPRGTYSANGQLNFKLQC